MVCASVNVFGNTSLQVITAVGVALMAALVDSILKAQKHTHPDTDGWKVPAHSPSWMYRSGTCKALARGERGAGRGGGGGGGGLQGSDSSAIQLDQDKMEHSNKRLRAEVRAPRPRSTPTRALLARLLCLSLACACAR